jgi:hypothetical protein
MLMLALLRLADILAPARRSGKPDRRGEEDAVA